MSVQAFKLVNRSERAVLAGRLQAVVASWVDAHCAAGVKTDVRVCAGLDDLAERAAGREWLIGTAQQAPVLALGLPPGWPQALARRLLACRPANTLDAAGSKLVRRMGTRVLQDLGHSLYEAACQARAQQLVWTLDAMLPMMAPRPGEAFVRCECPLGEDFPIQFLLWPATVLHSAVSHPAAVGGEHVTPLSRALDRQVVCLDALAGEAEIAFQELATLSLGDVLKLDRRLSEPVEVRVHGGGPVGSARLGVSHGRLAIQLTQQ